MTNSDKVRTVAIVLGVLGSILGSTAVLLSIFENGESKDAKKVGRKS